jgi:hypothetical protein
MAFLHWRPRENPLLRMLVGFAPYTFGVYLIHEHIELRYLWPQWLAASSEGAPLLFVANCLWKVFLVFVICLVADRCRALLFLGVKHILCRRWIYTLLKKADACINGDSRSAEHAAERK